MSATQTKRRPWAALLLVAAIFVSLLVVLYPAFIIQPFRAQVAGQLDLALTVVRFAPLTTILMLLLGVLCTFSIGPRGWLRITGTVFALVLLAFAAVVSRVDYFEIMFHPDPSPRFVAVDQSAFGPADMMLVARLGHAAHAYPVRMIAYHHLINDTLGGVPIVATY